MPSEENKEKILEWAKKTGEKYAKKLREVSENPDLDLSSEYKKICEEADKKLDVYFDSHKVEDSRLRNKVGELVFDENLLKTYNELIEQRR